MNYEELLEKAKETYESEDTPHVFKAWLLANIIGPADESEDERIRKGLIKAVSRIFEGHKLFDTDVTREEALAWLEKQRNKIVDCQQNHQDVKYPNGGIVMEDFNGGEGFYKLHLDYLSKKQVEEVEEMVRLWNKESKTSNENIKNCVEVCLTDANEQRFEDFGTTLKDCLTWLEKQGESSDKAEPKFKVGDLITNGYCLGKVIVITNDAYLLDTGQGIPFSCENTHLWTIADAKDGDVLVDSYSKDSIIILYKGIYKERSILAHCGWNGYNFSVKTNGLGYGGLDNTNYLPATKEQRDLLFQKMKEAGYEWNADKKELKKTEVTSKENEDEKIKKEIIDFFELPHPQFVGERDQEEWLAWIEKQGNFKMVDSSKVIEWLKPYSVIDENIVKCFKKDFGL